MTNLRLQAVRSANSAAYVKGVSERMPDLAGKDVKRLKGIVRGPSKNAKANGTVFSAVAARFTSQIGKFIRLWAGGKKRT